ncbi:MAG: hypothetical protein IKN12_12360 [Selenomonadaceae bacterium]|nr:hypothetical protein [Selenomonadaceae bacterium]
MTIQELLERVHDGEANEGLDVCNECNKYSCAFRHTYDWQKKAILKNLQLYPLFQCSRVIGGIYDECRCNPDA